MSPNQDSGHIGPLMDVIGSKLREARNSLALNQEAVSSALGIGRPRYSEIENGKRNISVDELYKFAQFFNRPTSYFITEAPSEGESFSVLCRSVKRDTQTRKTVAHFQRLCDNMHFLETLLKISHVMKQPPPDYHYELARYKHWAKIRAESERDQLGVGREPLKNLQDILEEKRNIKIFRLPLKNTISGMFTFSEKFGGCILINSNHPPGRQLFSLAHEYGHFLFHKKRIGCITYCESRQDRDEKFIDYFAQELLMPENLVLEIYETKLGGKKKLSAEDVVYLADYFGVSFAAMAWRLRYLNKISEKILSGILKKTVVSKVRKAMRLEEPNQKYDRLPRLYRYFCLKAYVNEKVTVSKFAGLLEIPLYQAMIMAKGLRTK